MSIINPRVSLIPFFALLGCSPSIEVLSIDDRAAGLDKAVTVAVEPNGTSISSGSVELATEAEAFEAPLNVDAISTQQPEVVLIEGSREIDPNAPFNTRVSVDFTRIGNLFPGTKVVDVAAETGSPVRLAVSTETSCMHAEAPISVAYSIAPRPTNDEVRLSLSFAPISQGQCAAVQSGFLARNNGARTVYPSCPGLYRATLAAPGRDRIRSVQTDQVEVLCKTRSNIGPQKRLHIAVVAE